MVSQIGVYAEPDTVARDFLEIPDGIPMDQRYFTDPNGGIYGKNENAWLDYQNAIEQYLENYDHPLIDLPDPDESASESVWILRRPLLVDYDESSGIEDWKANLRGEPVKVRKTRVQPKDPAKRCIKYSWCLRILGGRSGSEIKN